MKAPIKEGIVVISQKGRDKGRSFVVLCLLDADFALVADGRTRKLEKPKKKRHKHLLTTSRELPGILALYRAGRLKDSDLRSALEPPVSTPEDRAN